MLKIRPRDGWRVFAGEVGVIVLGVLIALGAQQLADEWQWRQKVARTKADLNAQISDTVAWVAERSAVEPCLTRRLTELAAKVAANRGRWTADPYILPGEHSLEDIVHYAIPPAYRMPGRTYTDDVWQQAKAAGFLAHMTPDDIKKYSYAFLSVDGIRTNRTIEGELAPELSFLSFDAELDASTRARTLSTIAKLDDADRTTLSVAKQLVEQAKDIGIRLSPADEKILAENLRVQQQFRGSCVDRAAAEKLVAPLRR